MIKIMSLHPLRPYRHDQRPDKIFLVTGQTLTSQFAITHHKKRGSAYEAAIAPKAGFCSILEADTRLGYHLENATASMRFKFSPMLVTILDIGDPVCFLFIWKLGLV